MNARRNTLTGTLAIKDGDVSFSTKDRAIDLHPVLFVQMGRRGADFMNRWIDFDMEAQNSPPPSTSMTEGGEVGVQYLREPIAGLWPIYRRLCAAEPASWGSSQGLRAIWAAVTLADRLPSHFPRCRLSRHPIRALCFGDSEPVVSVLDSIRETLELRRSRPRDPAFTPADNALDRVGVNPYGAEDTCHRMRDPRNTEIPKRPTDGMGWAISSRILRRS